MGGSAGRRRSGVAMALLAVLCVAGGGVGAADFSAQEVYRRAAPSVVMVYARLDGSTSSTGTGSIIDARGFVLTNAHVVSTEDGRSSNDVAVFFKPARVTGDMKNDLRDGHRAVVVARSPKLDLALLRVEGGLPSGIPALAFGNSERIEIGEPVAAIGHPGGGGLWTLTTGTISSARRRGDVDVFQTDAAINPGNSGGPLLDSDARLIGLNTFVVRVSDSGLPLEGLNYSLRGNVVRAWLSDHGVDVAVRDRSIAVASNPTPRQTLPAAEPAEPQPAPAPRPAAPAAPEPPRAQPPPAGGAEPRAFQGPDGERMYGVPDRSFSHDGLKSELYARTRKNAADAFDELDEMDTSLDFE